MYCMQVSWLTRGVWLGFPFLIAQKTRFVQLIQAGKTLGPLLLRGSEQKSLQRQGAGLRPAGNESGFAPDAPGRCEPGKALSHILAEATATTGPPAPTRTGGPEKVS